ncbi:MAG: PQQ-binding-like beta-propeller repeat protein [Dehalococcoidales bacterium]|nr:PQQ-binding-like beta-propeller repeat protein [Dehalococcoidales bacterium]
MLTKKKIRPVYKLALLFLAVLAGIVLLSGCATTRGAVARGWAGGVIQDDILYIGSMTGNIVTVDLNDGSMIQNIPVEEVQAATGFMSCARGSTSAVMYGNPVVDGDIIYVTGYNTQKIYAISTSTLLSTEKLVEAEGDNKAYYLVGGPIIDGDRVFIGSSDGRIYAYSTVSLKTAWRKPFESGDKIWSTPAVSDGTLYVGSFDKKMYALNAADGSLKWEYESGGAIITTPVIENNVVYFGAFDRNIYALNAATGSLKWQFAADNWFWAKPLVSGNKLYAPCLDGKVYVLDTASGQKLDEYDLENPISSSPVIVDGLLIVATQLDTKGDTRNSVLHSIDIASGTHDELDVFDENESVYANLIAGDGKVYVHTTLNKLYEVDVKTGAEREIVIEVETEEED